MSSIDPNHNDNHDAETNNGTGVETEQIMVAMAEEEVQLQSTQLEGLRQRRDTLLLQREKTRKRKQDLQQQESQIQARWSYLQEARRRHLKLQDELRESLTKSRERLEGLTQLEALSASREMMDSEHHDPNDPKAVVMEENALHFDTDEVAMAEATEKSDDNDLGSSDCSDNDIDEDGERKLDDPGKSAKRQRQIDDDSSGISTKDGSRFDSLQQFNHFPLLVDLNDLDMLQDYHKSKLLRSVRRRSNPQLLNFIPSMDAATVAHYLKISIRECSALDMECVDRSISPRQELMDGSILDICLLIQSDNKQMTESTVGERKSIQNTRIVKSTTSSLETPFDPNLSLCPYELSGICADDSCPYQHTTKIPSVIARERLPLPTINLFLSQDKQMMIEKTDQNEKTETMEERNDNLSQGLTNTLPVSHSPQPAAQEETPSIHGQETSSSSRNLKGTIADGPRNQQTETSDFSVADQEDFLALPEDDGDNEENISTIDDDAGVDDTEMSISPNSSDDGTGISQIVRTDCKENDSTDSFVPLTETNSFWWGGRLPVPTQTEDSHLSIIDILDTTFGVHVHKDPNLPTQLRLELTGFPLQTKNTEDNSTSLSHVLASIGRAVDAVRLATHGGRFDVAMAINKILTSEVSKCNLCPSSLESLMQLLHEQTLRLWKHNDEYNSCFGTQVATMLVHAMISTSLLILWSDTMDSQSSSDVNCDMSASLLSSCKDCANLMNECDSDEEHSTGGCQTTLNELLMSAKSGSNFENVFSSTKDLIMWCQRTFVPPSDEASGLSTHAMIDKISSLHRSIKVLLQDASKDDHVDTSLGCLRATVLVANATLQCFSRVISEISRESTSQWIGKKRSLATNVWAGWTALDTTLFDVLKGLWREIAMHDPMAMLVLAPVAGVSVASSCFIRKYSVAQNRLLQWIGNNTEKQMHNNRSISLLKFSELLWSQLIQLRMSLPCLSSIGNESNAGGSGRQQWQANNVDEKDIAESLSTILGELGVRLHHVTAFGDWLLTDLAKNAQSRDDTMQQDGTILSVMKAYTGNTDSVSGPAFNELNLSVDSCRLFPPTAPLSSVPFLMLHIGQNITTLDFSNCMLHRLPLTFGNYFPNMKHLSLACNELIALPKSFEQLPSQMPRLESLRLDRNRLRCLPDDIFVSDGNAMSWTLRFLDLSHNLLASLPPLPPAFLGSLEDLYLGHNGLVNMTFIDFSRLALKLPNLRDLVFQPQEAIVEDEKES